MEPCSAPRDRRRRSRHREVDADRSRHRTLERRRRTGRCRCVPARSGTPDPADSRGVASRSPDRRVVVTGEGLYAWFHDPADALRCATHVRAVRNSDLGLGLGHLGCGPRPRSRDRRSVFQPAPSQWRHTTRQSRHQLDRRVRTARGVIGRPNPASTRHLGAPHPSADSRTTSRRVDTVRWSQATGSGTLRLDKRSRDH